MSDIQASSFRDPSGFVFHQDQRIYRQVNQSYQKDYDFQISSGLYQHLVDKKMLIPHQEVAIAPPVPELAYRILEPEEIEFISYPYEWCFSELKDAALLTLAVQKLAIQHGMSLKDASAYNIQFRHGKAVLIDSLSFEIYPEGLPWTAYRQFCQHFLAPLALMAYRDVRLSQLFRIYIDGVPLDLASRLLPFRTRLNFGLLTHLHLHASAQKRYSDKDIRPQAGGQKVSQTSILALVDNLEATIRKLSWQVGGSEWANYYSETNYSETATSSKTEIVRGFIQTVQPRSILDLGANTGVFSRIAAEMGIATIAADIDPGAVELNYLEVKKKKEKNLLPLILDLTNPSPGLGWENRERDAFFQRQSSEAVMALALIHHLAISNNLPLDHLAEFFSRLSKWLIIEFIPKEDSQVQRLLQTRKDIFESYHVDGFETAFSRCFQIREKRAVADSQRILYLMETRAS